MDFERPENKNKGVDIISRLPDHVLSHILSRLETKEAIRTSILSRRWKNLWTSVYKLHFVNERFSHDKLHIDDESFSYDSDSEDDESFSHDRDIEENCRTGFVEFVERVLSLCQSKDIQDFQLNCTSDLQDSDLPRISEWLCFAAERNVRVLTLKIDIGNVIVHDSVIRIPQTIITCKSLVKLELRSETCDFVFDISDSVVSFPSLKILCIEVGNPDGDQMQKLFRSCPVLEELTIHGDIEHDIEGLTFDITVPTLRKLNIHMLMDCYINDVSPHKFVVRACNLEYLNITDDSYAWFVVDETPALFSANLKFGQPLSQMFSILSRNEANRAMELLRAVRNTKSLLVSFPLMGVLIKAFDGNFPTFLNLTHLELGIEASLGWKLLPHFLHNSPNLEILMLEKEHLGLRDVDMSQFSCFESESVPYCLLSHVKTIEIRSMKGEFDELEVVKYLLKHSKVLERFTAEIDVSDYWREQLIEHQISAFPRSSAICSIKFHFIDSY